MKPNTVEQTFSLGDRVYRTKFPNDGAYTVVSARLLDNGLAFRIQCVCNPHTNANHINDIWLTPVEIKHV